MSPRGGCEPRALAPGNCGRDARQLVALDMDVGALAPAGSELGNAVDPVTLAVRALTLRFGAGD